MAFSLSILSYFCIINYFYSSILLLLFSDAILLFSLSLSSISYTTISLYLWSSILSYRSASFNSSLSSSSIISGATPNRFNAYDNYFLELISFLFLTSSIASNYNYSFSNSLFLRYFSSIIFSISIFFLTTFSISCSLLTINYSVNLSFSSL